MVRSSYRWSIFSHMNSVWAVSMPFCRAKLRILAMESWLFFPYQWYERTSTYFHTSGSFFAAWMYRQVTPALIPSGNCPLVGRPRASILAPSTFVISATTPGVKALWFPASLQMA